MRHPAPPDRPAEHVQAFARRPRLTLLLLAALAAAAVLGVPAVRNPVLRGAGWALVAEDPIERADVIVTTAVGGSASVLEAAAMVKRGVASRVAVFADPPEAANRELLRRGIPIEDQASTSVRQLALLGIEDVERIPKPATGTEEEARVLPEWCRQRQLRSVVLITTADHSRRLRRVFNRAMIGGTTVAVRATRYSTFNPDRWWQTRDGTRTWIVEVQKLLLDLALHPLP